MSLTKVAEQVVEKEIITFGGLTKALEKIGYKKTAKCTGKVFNEHLSLATKKCGKERTERINAVHSVINDFFESSVVKAPLKSTVSTTESPVISNNKVELTMPENPTCFDEMAHYILTTSFNEFDVQMKLQDMGLDFRKGKSVEDVKIALNRAMKKKCTDEFVRLGILSTAIEKLLKKMSVAKQKNKRGTGDE